MVVESSMNALHNVRNPYQGSDEKILCVCSAGLLRSPTTANILAKAGYNVRACGVHDYALIPISSALIEWADRIVFADKEHYEAVKYHVDGKKENVYILDVPDRYGYMNPALVKLIRIKLKEFGLLRRKECQPTITK